MADEAHNRAKDKTKGDADRQCPATAADANANALAENPPAKGRIHRPKLSLRYRPQELATDL